MSVRVDIYRSESFAEFQSLQWSLEEYSENHHKFCTSIKHILVLLLLKKSNMTDYKLFDE